MMNDPGGDKAYASGANGNPTFGVQGGGGLANCDMHEAENAEADNEMAAWMGQVAAMDLAQAAYAVGGSGGAGGNYAAFWSAAIALATDIVSSLPNNGDSYNLSMSRDAFFAGVGMENAVDNPQEKCYCSRQRFPLFKWCFKVGNARRGGRRRVWNKPCKPFDDI
jgi:hypothetical protein